MMSDATWGTLAAADLAALAEAHGTPFYLYDADAICGRIESVRSAFANQAQVYYAVKANPNLQLLRAVRGTADGLDISSGGELEQALLAGFDASQLSFAGPGKSTEELAASIASGVGCISIESPRELSACIEIAQRTGVRANVLVRVNPLLQNRAFGIKMGGRPVQFGVDEEELGGVTEMIRRNASMLDFHGIHVYSGSQCFDPAGTVDGVIDTLRIAREVETAVGQPCAVVNLGGGFGVSHTDQDRELDIDAAAKELVPALRAFQAESSVPRKVVFELGRYLTADAGLYVCRVLSSKRSRGKLFYVVDGGLHHHLSAAGTFGAALRSNFQLRNLTRGDAPSVRCSLAGPSCNPTDLLGVDVELPEPQLDDLLGVLKSGSYGLTASPILFLGRRTPAELVLHHGQVTVGRHPRSMIDFN